MTLYFREVEVGLMGKHGRGNSSQEFDQVWNLQNGTEVEGVTIYRRISALIHRLRTGCYNLPTGCYH